MGQPKEKPTVEQVLKLVEELTLEEQAQVREALDLQELRRNIRAGLEQSARGEHIDGDEVFRLLRKRNAEMREKGSP